MDLGRGLANTGSWKWTFKEPSVLFQQLQSNGIEGNGVFTNGGRWKNCWKNTDCESSSLNVHFHLRVFAKPPSQSPVHFFPKANLLVFQRENKGMRLTLHISSKKTLNTFSFKVYLIFGNNHLWRHAVYFLLFVFVFPAVPSVGTRWEKTFTNNSSMVK